MITVAACGGDSAPTAPPAPSTEQVALVYQEALVEKDLAKFSDILADDFVFTQVPGPGGTEQLTVTGKSAFMVRLAGQMENNTVLTPSETVYEGDKATGKFSITADNFKAIGVDSLSGTFESIGREGKLVSLATVIDGLSLQKMGAAMAALAPPGIAQLGDAYLAALNSGDLAAFNDIFAVEYVRTLVPGAGGTDKQTITGRSTNLLRIAGLIENNSILTLSDRTVQGDTSTGKYSLTADNLDAIGVDSLSGTYTSTSRNGKIVTLDTVTDGPSLQKLGAAMAALAPPNSDQLGQAYFEALAAKDLAKVADILAEDFVFTQVPGPGGTEQLTVNGRSAFMVRLAGQMENNTLITDSDAVVDGDKANGKYSITADNFRAIGIDNLSGSYEAISSDGKLARLDTVIDGPSLQKLGAALAALPPPSN